MTTKKKTIEATSDKLNHSTKVLLKRWAGLSGFYGYKLMEFDEVCALLNSNGWRLQIDDSVASVRIVELYQGETRVRREKFTMDEAGKVHMV
ncbi:hypothetical protein [Paenibacillus sp. N3.4]|uniref:hypothetical protein n=1 Tax=Paenibacillus sp. N3.4 TaxID=2603222 RepID=UPI0011CBB125|nr:hypothetical protein [Paenibacillus sp. N3.4]TXK85809.1 hypothetical protein FU659_02600 [Paenibacillus sp. N3.4]